MKIQKLSHHITNLWAFLPSVTAKGKFWLHKVLLRKEGSTYIQENGVPICWFKLNKIQSLQTKWSKEEQ